MCRTCYQKRVFHQRSTCLVIQHPVLKYTINQSQILQNVLLSTNQSEQLARCNSNFLHRNLNNFQTLCSIPENTHK